jgi:hypothetical protein
VKAGGKQNSGFLTLMDYTGLILEDSTLDKRYVVKFILVVYTVQLVGIALSSFARLIAAY